MNRHKGLFSVIATFLATSLIWAGVFSVIYMNDPVSRKVGRAYNLINKNYIFDFDEEFVKDYTIASMIYALGDRYSTFYPKDYFESLESSMNGHYYGIGIKVVANEKTNELVVYSVQENTPAEQAGIAEGDILIKVEDKAVSAENFDETIDMIKVDEKGLGTTIKLTFKRGDTEYEADVAREKIVTITVESEILEGDVGYIKIDSFDNETIREFKENAEKIKGTKYLILDLRNNGGGTLYSMRQIADMLLPKCTLTTFEYKNGKKTELNTSGKQILKMPMCVLVNEGSASASELLTAALHDNGRATVVGEKTFGKAIAQEAVPFEYEKGKPVSAVYLTYARYLTPKGEYIHDKGILPDVVVEQDDDVKTGSESDKQLNTALKEVRKSQKGEK